MSAHLLAWGRGEGLSVVRDRCASGARKVGERGRRLVMALPLVVLPMLTLLLSSQARHWVVEAIATVCVLGGFILAPVLTLVAWVGMMVPEYMPLHQLSSPFFAVALIWICAALVGAHVHHGLARRQD